MRAKKTLPWVGCFGLAIAMTAQTSVAQEMSKADTEQMQRLVVPMIQADERLKPILLMSAHFGACLSAYEKDFQPERLATLRLMDKLTDQAGRTEMAKLIAEAPANERSDVTALLMGYSVAMRVGASNSVPSLGDCVETIKTLEAKIAADSASPLAAIPQAAASTPSSAPTSSVGESFRDCPDCPQMVSIPAGSFMMGSPSSEVNRDDSEGPQRRVTVPAFAAGKYEVTWAEWDRCVAAGGCVSLEADGFGGGSRPVTNVSWIEAVAYTQWLSSRTGKTYRLLSEAEWEYAARAGTSSTYWWGGSARHEYANYGKDTCCDGLASGSDRWVNTSPVGSFPANNFGLHDMHGNVYELVQDCFEDSYSAGQPSNGSAYQGGLCSDRVIRGGSWNSNPRYLRSADRDGDAPAGRSSDFGFRVARTL